MKVSNATIAGELRHYATVLSLQGANRFRQKAFLRAAETIESQSKQLNSKPNRLDLNDENARLARDGGINIVVNTDAHNIRALKFIFRQVLCKRGTPGQTRWTYPIPLPVEEPLQNLRRRSAKFDCVSLSMDRVKDMASFAILIPSEKSGRSKSAKTLTEMAPLVDQPLGKSAFSTVRSMTLRTDAVSRGQASINEHKSASKFIGAAGGTTIGTDAVFSRKSLWFFDSPRENSNLFNVKGRDED